MKKIVTVIMVCVLVLALACGVSATGVNSNHSMNKHEALVNYYLYAIDASMYLELEEELAKGEQITATWEVEYYESIDAIRAFVQITDIEENTTVEAEIIVRCDDEWMDENFEYVNWFLDEDSEYVLYYSMITHEAGFVHP